jgi:hypothetical protein
LTWKPRSSVSSACRRPAFDQVRSTRTSPPKESLQRCHYQGRTSHVPHAAGPVNVTIPEPVLVSLSLPRSVA